MKLLTMCMSTKAKGKYTIQCIFGNATRYKYLASHFPRVGAHLRIKLDNTHRRSLYINIAFEQILKPTVLPHAPLVAAFSR